MKALLCCITIAITLALTACTDSPVRARLDLADSLMESRPDSALTILDSISAADLRGDALKARHALLLSMALDKNYIDTTTFDVLQPAIDYYPRHGSPDEKLRTYYYQGRIYQNRGEYNDAMLRYMEACDLRGKITDSLTLARTLVAQGGLYLEQYKIKQYMQANAEAAELFEDCGKKIQQVRSYGRMLTGCVLLEDKTTADSVMSCLNSVSDKTPDIEGAIAAAYLNYTVEFGSSDEIKDVLNKYSTEPTVQNDFLTLSYANARAEKFDEALELLHQADLEGFILDSLRQISVLTYILEEQGLHKQALEAYKDFSAMNSRYMYDVLSYDIFFADKRHQLEVDRLNAVSHRDRIIWCTVCIIFVLLLAGGLIYHRYRLVRSKRKLAEKENENLRLQQLVLRNELETLESERDNLKELLAHSHQLDRPIQEIIKQRLDMLNGLLAREIANNDNYAAPYNRWIESMNDNKDAFMNSTRLTFKATHPKFMEYLEDHGLTDTEINYVCLYAIGLRGKEVGEYIRSSRHYHLSSDIRRKLGIDGHQTNIGIYIRKLIAEFDN